MKGLFASEVLRTRSRRLVLLVVVGALAGSLIGVGIGTARSRVPSDEDIAAAEREHGLALADCIRFSERPPEGYPSAEAFCEDVVRLEDFLPSRQIQLSALPRLLEGLGTVVVLLAIIIGASLAGADWSAGTMTTLLVWEPRRARLLLVRLAVVALVSLLLISGMQAWLAALFRAGVALRGTTAGADDWLGDVAGVIVRSSLAATLWAVLAFSLASITRATAAGLGILLGYVVIVEGFLSNIWFDLQPWLLLRATVGVISGDVVRSYDPSTGQEVLLMTVSRSWLIVVGYALVSLAVATVSFRRRDVN